MARPKEKTVFGEEIHKKWFFIKRYTFTCDLVVYDAANFAIIFSTVTSNLLAWHRQHQGKSAGFTLRLTSTSLVKSKAIDMMENLYHSGEPFEFLKNCDVILQIHNVDTQLTDTYIPSVENNQ